MSLELILLAKTGSRLKVLEALLFPDPVAVGANGLIGVTTVGAIIRATHLTTESGLDFFSANSTCRHRITRCKNHLMQARDTPCCY
jgi:hypothetical protein